MHPNDYTMTRDIPAVKEAVESGRCRFCAPPNPEAKTEQPICIECGRCTSCKCSPTCVTRKPKDPGPAVPVDVESD